MTDAVKITLRNLPKPLHAALKKEAERSDRSLNWIVTVALSVYVDGLKLRPKRKLVKRAKGKR